MLLGFAEAVRHGRPQLADSVGSLSRYEAAVQQGGPAMKSTLRFQASKNRLAAHSTQSISVERTARITYSSDLGLLGYL